MHDLNEFKKKRKDLKIRLKAAQREVDEIKEELDNLRHEEQHRAVDNLEYWLDEEETHHVSVIQGIRQMLNTEASNKQKTESKTD